jgi:hypothetical protein
MLGAETAEIAAGDDLRGSCPIRETLDLEAGLPADNAASNKRRSSTKSTHV